MFEELFKLKNIYLIAGGLSLISIVNISIGIYSVIKENKRFKKDNNIKKIDVNDVENDVNYVENDVNDVEIDVNDVEIDVNDVEIEKIITMEKVDNISNELSVLYSTLEEIKNKMDDLHK